MKKIHILKKPSLVQNQDSQLIQEKTRIYPHYFESKVVEFTEEQRDILEQAYLFNQVYFTDFISKQTIYLLKNGFKIQDLFGIFCISPSKFHKFTKSYINIDKISEAPNHKEWILHMLTNHQYERSLLSLLNNPYNFYLLHSYDTRKTIQNGCTSKEVLKAYSKSVEVDNIQSFEFFLSNKTRLCANKIYSSHSNSLRRINYTSYNSVLNKYLQDPNKFSSSILSEYIANNKVQGIKTLSEHSVNSQTRLSNNAKLNGKDTFINSKQLQKIDNVNSKNSIEIIESGMEKSYLEYADFLDQSSKKIYYKHFISETSINLLNIGITPDILLGIYETSVENYYEFLQSLIPFISGVSGIKGIKIAKILLKN